MVPIQLIPSTSQVESYILNNGAVMPAVGLGLYQIPPGAAAEEAVRCALETGYRLIDTARFYENEKDAGRAVTRSGIPREDVFVTTKLWNDDHGYDATLRAFDRSNAELGLNYVDLYLIHWPVKTSTAPGWRHIAKALDRFGLRPQKLRLESWRAMERLVASGRCRAIGVCNYTVRHLRELLDVCETPPAVNQVEFTPFCFQRELLEFCQQRGIRVQAYSPLVRGKRLVHPVLNAVAEKHKRAVPQILLRWALQHGVAVIPKSSRPEHLRENFQLFDFVLPTEDMARLDNLNEDLHLCWDPTNAP